MRSEVCGDFHSPIGCQLVGNQLGNFGALPRQNFRFGSNLQFIRFRANLHANLARSRRRFSVSCRDLDAFRLPSSPALISSTGRGDFAVTSCGAFPAQEFLRAFPQYGRWPVARIAHEQLAIRREIDRFLLGSGQHRGALLDLDLDLETVGPRQFEGAAAANRGCPACAEIAIAVARLSAPFARLASAGTRRELRRGFGPSLQEFSGRCSCRRETGIGHLCQGPGIDKAFRFGSWRGSE